MPKVHGWIITDLDGRLVVGPYGDVLLFTKHEDTIAYTPIGGRTWKVVTAKVKRGVKK